MTQAAEDYFERDEDGIRLKGHRIWLENVLDLYQEGMTADEIAHEYTTLTLEEAEAAVAYYHAHTAEVDAYLAQQRREAEEREREADAHPTPLQLRLQRLMDARRKARAADSARA
jgi:uncharacterized protein (DUF433 family)